MSFTIVQTPQVDLVVSTFSAELHRYFYQTVRPIIADNPYPSAGFTLVESFVGGDGHEYYLYFDGILPAAFRYRVFTTSSGSRRDLVVIMHAIPVDLL